MSNRFLSLSLATALTVSASVASAAEPAPVRGTEVVGAKTVGAMTFETYGRAVGPADIVRQGGFVAASMARWTPAPVTEIHASAF